MSLALCADARAESRVLQLILSYSPRLRNRQQRASKQASQQTAYSKDRLEQSLAEAIIGRDSHLSFVTSSFNLLRAWHSYVRTEPRAVAPHLQLVHDALGHLLDAPLVCSHKQQRCQNCPFSPILRHCQNEPVSQVACLCAYS
jgi:hypothetical protein